MSVCLYFSIKRVTHFLQYDPNNIKLFEASYPYQDFFYSGSFLDDVYNILSYWVNRQNMFNT